LKICYISLLPLPPFPWMLRLQMWTTTPGSIVTFLASGLESYIGQSSLPQDYKIMCLVPFLGRWGGGTCFKLKASHLQSRHSTAWAKRFDHFALVILEMGGLMNYLLGLASNHDTPDLNLPSSQDYRHKPPMPGFSF
jgi:hypothetical protein